MCVFCGANGTGKSSVFDAIKFLRDLATGNCFLGKARDDTGGPVSKLEFTHWLDSRTQEFEIEIEAEGHHFSYVIHLEQTEPHEPRIIKEIAACEGKELYARDLEGVHFDKGRSGFPLDWRQAALASIQPVPERREIQILQKALAALLILRPNMRGVEYESREEHNNPNLNLSNLTSWYRHLAQDQECTDLLRNSLRDIWQDLKFLKLADAGLFAKVLELHFEGEKLLFNQLSDGEKMLIGLYMIHTSLSQGHINTVLIDEPDNFVSLQELQPWLLSMCELMDDNHQALIISHNQEILDSSPAAKFYFWRDNHRSPARAGPFIIPEGMTAGEALLRGWVGQDRKTES
jgi:predicted ATPase